jgi:hypothetical protein
LVMLVFECFSLQSQDGLGISDSFSIETIVH